MLKKHLNKFIIVYLNNIIIYLDLKEEHKKHIKWVLERLHTENILIVIKKCEFYTVKPLYNDTTYLANHIVIPKVLLYPILVYKMNPK